MIVRVPAWALARWSTYLAPGEAPRPRKLFWDEISNVTAERVGVYGVQCTWCGATHEVDPAEYFVRDYVLRRIDRGTQYRVHTHYCNDTCRQADEVHAAS